MMVKLIDLALMLVEGARPLAVGNGMGGILVKRLPQIFRAGPAEVNPLRLAAAHRNRRNTGVGLELCDTTPAIPLRTKGGQQARSQNLAGAGKRGEDLRVGMRCVDSLAGPLQLGDALPQR